MVRVRNGVLAILIGSSACGALSTHETNISKTVRSSELDLLGITSKQTLTLSDYPSKRNSTYTDNPPFCQVHWADLDLKRITAQGAMSLKEGRHNCGDCLRVCGSVGCKNLLVVDQTTVSPNHLDISTAAGPAIVGLDTGRFVVDVTKVEPTLCRGIWNGKMLHDELEPWTNKHKLVDGVERKGRSRLSGVYSGGSASGSASSESSSSGSSSRVSSDTTGSLRAGEGSALSSSSKELTSEISGDIPGESLTGSIAKVSTASAKVAGVGGDTVLALAMAAAYAVYVI